MMHGAHARCYVYYAHDMYTYIHIRTMQAASMEQMTRSLNRRDEYGA